MANVQSKIAELVENKINEKELFINNIVNSVLRIIQEGNKYKLDNNAQIDYLNDLNNSDASLIYSLLEEDYLEEMKENNSSDLFTNDGGDFTNFPQKIDSDIILQFEEVAGALVENPDNIQDQYAVGRYGEITDQRTKPAFLSELQTRLDNFIAPLDTQRLDKVVEYTNDVYSDYTEVKDKVSLYLNKSGTRYSTSTEYGSYSASFKSSCGDYSEALGNVDSQYDATKSIIGGNFFQSDLSFIKDGTKSIITGHLGDQTIRYKYYKNTRSGSSKYDNYHSAISGTYSCSYDCNVYSSCASTTPVVCDSNGTNCTGGDCVAGYVWTSNGCTESSSCQTFGSTGSNCSAQCNGYHVPYYGSLYDDNGDVNNDWDNSCAGSYEWYNTNDNNGIRGSKTISGVNVSGYFGSWGTYSCDNFPIRSTGNDRTKCVYNRHDQVDNYRNTVPSSALSWSSTSKKLDTSTNAVEAELVSWMEVNNFKDSSDSSPYFTGSDNVRYGLAYDSANGINTESDSYVVPLIRTKVVNLYKNYLTNYYNNLLNANLSQVNTDLTNLINSEYESYYNAYFADNWHKFNRIKIEDAEVRPEDANSVNFDITLPGGHYVKNPNAFSITIAPHYEVRKYRCYTDWKTCDTPDNCTFDKENITNYITDSDHKSVATMKDVEFKCDSQNTVSVCESLKITKQCNDLNMTMPHIEYDDTDFSQDFYSNIGKTMALNESIKIFGAKPLNCEEGLFIDMSWAEDPLFWAGALMAGLSQLQGFSAFTEGMKGWASTAMGSLSFIGDTAQCAMAFGSCMSAAGFGPVDLVSNMFSTSAYDPVSGSYPPAGVSASDGSYIVNNAQQGCLQAGGDASCGEFAAQFAGESSAMMSSLANSQAMTSIATTLGFQSGASMMAALGNPLVGLAVQVIMNLALNTFDSCSQCTSKDCAESHDPQEAKQLIAMTDALKVSSRYSGSEYGLGADFQAYNNCFFKSSGCAAKFIGSCIRDYKTFCCYNSRMSRILAGQIYQQLGYTYQADGCSAIGIEDLSRIDFSMCASGVIPNPSNKCLNYKEIEDYMMSQINWDTQKSFDVNTVIQTSINAARTMN
ncbi:conjugal transfer protein TraN [Sulfurimonas indica]|uniref:conjugal transfer protein TraN n=1 Tax=Sulfurimonas indica TaxID=2508707 RepID=UPI00165FA78C|nr:conjugal transfer protein TraN [Sulfurimonas indica]